MTHPTRRRLLQGLLTTPATAWLSSAAQAQPTRITLIHTGLADYAAVFAGVEDGSFDRQALGLDLRAVAAPALVPGLSSGMAQIATVPPPALIRAAAAGIDLVAIAGCSRTQRDDPNPALLVKADGPVKTAADLAGRKVAVVGLGGTLHIVARQWLAAQGVPERGVSFVEVAFPQMADVLKGGSVDAVVIADPFRGRALQSGVARPLAALNASLPEGSTGVVYASSRDWAQRNPKLVAAFRAGLEAGVASVRKDAEAARAHISKHTKVPLDVLARLPLPQLSTELTADQLRFWIMAMKTQGLLNDPLPDPQRLLLA